MNSQSSSSHENKRKQKLGTRQGVEPPPAKKSNMFDYLTPTSSTGQNNRNTDSEVNADVVPEITLTSEENVNSTNTQILKKNNFEIPKWLTKYFTYIGHVQNSSTKRIPVKMKCQLCAKNSSSKDPHIIAPPFFNFVRHLENTHQDLYKEEIQAGNVKKAGAEKSNVSVSQLFTSGLWKVPSNKDAYPHTHPIQKQFVNDLLDCISMDYLPLDFISRPTFMKLIRNLDRKIRLVSRRTITRRFKEYYEKQFKPKMKKFVNELEDENLHIILDMWTDRRKSSIIGFKAQFIDKTWKLRNLVLAFRHFPDRHTAVNIRKIFESVLEKTFGISPKKVGFVHGDNAENVVAAFKSPKDKEKYTEIDEPEDNDNNNDDDDDEVNWVTFEELMESSDEEDDSQSSPDGFDVVCEGLDYWKGTKTIKLPCFSHLLQLIIKDALTSNPEASRLVKAANELKTFFHRSNYWYDKFKEEAKIGLTEQAETRWNTVYYVFTRLLKPNVQAALSKVLAETFQTKTPCKISFSQGDYANMQSIVNLLQPLQQATDELQADRVTSSKILPVIALAYKAIAAVDLDNNIEMEELKTKLCHCIADRFGSRRATEEIGPSGRRGREIVREDIYNNENIILASLLDPRIKTSPFLLKFDETSKFNADSCSKNRAEEILRVKYEKFKPEQTAAENMDKDDETRIPSSGSLLDALDFIDDAADHQSHIQENEVEAYLKENKLPRTADPLDYWKEKEKNFPTLARLARKYLGFPASSGSVERLFSISGATQRSRRAKLSWKTVEYLLCHKEMRTRELFQK